MRRPSSARGFTLVELIVALGVSVLVIAGAMALLVAQQRTFRVTAADRSVEEIGRISLEEITANLRMAGYGIDPAYAFDFGPLPAARQDRAPITAAVTAASTFSDCTAVSCRDSVTGADEIVFRYRDPSFVRSLSSAPSGATSLQVAGPLGSAILQGQILQVMCFSGDMIWAYVTVGQTVAATDADQVTIPLAGGNGDQFPYQNGFLSNSCFSSVAPRNAAATTFAAAAKVFKVNQFRYRVVRYDAAGAVVTGVNSTARPYLMLEQGLVRDGAVVSSVVAPDVEDLQFSYLFPNSAAGSQVVGAAQGISVTSDSTGIDLDPGVGPPSLADEGSATQRTTHHPGNIRAVGVSVVVRTPQADDAVFDTTVPAARNRPALTGPTGYRRILFETSAATRNLDARGPYFPVYSTSNGADRLNTGGG